MKPLVAFSLLLASGLAYAEAPSAFLSAADRQERIEQKSQEEQKRIEKLVKEAVKSIQGQSKESASSGTPVVDNNRSSSNQYKSFPKPGNTVKTNPEDPSDFAIAGIRGHHILIRQLNNKSMIVGSGESFYDKGDTYIAKLERHGSVSITREKDGKVVFYGGVGSVFTPGDSDSKSSEGSDL